MSEEPARKAHVTSWALSILGASVLYILSYAPVGHLSWLGIIQRPFPDWLEAFYTPYSWIYWKTPLRKPIEAYLSLWDEGNPYSALRSPRPYF